MRIFLAGASGAVGRPLIGMLTANGHEVVGTTRDPRKADLLRALGAKPVVLDVLDRDRLADAVREARPDAVIHQLTDLSRMDFAATNRLRIEGTRNLVDAARAVGVRRMVTQSFGPAYAPGEGLATEETPLYLNAAEVWSGGAALETEAGSVAAATDSVAAVVGALVSMEKAVTELPESVVLRYGLLYGPGTSFAADGFMTDQIRQGQMPANENVTSFIHIEDAARAAMLAIDWPAGVYNIVDDDPAPAREWLRLYAAEVGGPPPPQVDGKDALMSRGISNVKAKRQVGWSPRHPSWRAGFLTTVRV
jgi:nucleoside-diphosphate-sugar epimerase